MIAKPKICSVCNEEKALWRSTPKLCKDCDRQQKALNSKIEYTPITCNSYDGKKVNKRHSDEFGLMEQRNQTLDEVNGKKYKKVEIKPVSDKMAKNLKEYRIVRDAFMKENPFCQICGTVATDTHHKKGRGRYLTEVKYFMAVCRKCHTRIEDDSDYAYSNGYKIPRLEE